MRKSMQIIFVIFLLFLGFSFYVSLEKDADIIKAKNYLSHLSTRLMDGEKYGCDILCFIDELGLYYNLENDAECDATSLRFVFFKNEKQRITYRILLDVAEQHYCLGEMDVFVGAHEVWHSLKILHSPACELKPLWIDWPMIQTYLGKTPDTEKAGIIRSFDATKQEITVSQGKLGQESIDFPIGILKETISEEEIVLRITQNTLVTVWGDEMEMLVTGKHFFELLSEGYPYNDIDFYFNYEENGELLFLREIYQS